MTLAIILPLVVALVITLGVYARSQQLRHSREGFLPLLGIGASLLAPVVGGLFKKKDGGGGGGGGGGGPPRTNPAPRSGCQYKTRSWINNGWGCEPGWADTGADWQYGDNGDKQCENCMATAAPTPPPTNPPAKSGCAYKIRKWINNGWGCEAGWKDTGADWGKGAGGDKQCENCAPGALAAMSNAPPKPKCVYKTRTWINNGWGCEAGWRDTGNNPDKPGAHGEKQCENCTPGASATPTNPPPKSTCVYKIRSWINNGWGCEPGWTDTGANWDKGPNGDKQCENCTAGVTVPPPKSGRTNAPPKAGCQYKTREYRDSKWQCAAGWTDTDAHWQHGANGDKQCASCAPAK